jgi:hypothetical protein
MVLNVTDEIVRVANDLKLSQHDFRQCDPELARRVVGAVKETFVTGNPRSWWLSLKHSFESFDYPAAQGFSRITQHLPKGVKTCWFIPETEEDDLPIFDIAAHRIVEILSQCSLFEYYLVGKGYDWILIENDHNQIIFACVQ